MEHLAAALLLHTAARPELLAEARALRNRLRHQIKKKRQKAEKMKAAADALQRVVDSGADVAALVMAIGAAERLSAAADSKLGGLLGVARERLQHARQEETTAKKVAAIETMESECVALALSHGACAELEIDGCDDVEEDKLCVVCLAEAKEICLFPCGHVCVCRNCADAGAVLASREVMPCLPRHNRGHMQGLLVIQYALGFVWETWRHMISNRLRYKPQIVQACYISIYPGGRLSLE